MKLKLFKSVLLLGSLVALTTDATAQRSPRRRGGAPATTTPEQPAAPVTTDTVPQAAPVFNAYANLPFEYDTATADNTTRRSLRQDNAYDKSSLTQRTP
jgi:hypothetical protein